MALPHGDARVAVNPRRQPQPSVEVVPRQRPQRRCLGSEVLTDGVDAVVDPPRVIGDIRRPYARVQLRERCDDRHRGEVVAAEPAHFSFHATFLVRAHDTGAAVERVEAHV